MKKLLGIYLLSLAIFIVFYPLIEGEAYSLKLVFKSAIVALGVPLAFLVIKPYKEK